MTLWRRQRGAAAVFAALATVAAVSAFSLVFHAAQLYLAKRDLQRLANMAAMDAAMMVGGCLDGRVTDYAALADEQARLSLLRNGDASAQDWLEDGEVVIGELRREGGLRSVSTPRQLGNSPAVRVTLSRPQPNFLTQAFGAKSSARLVASASAIAGPEVAPFVGSYIANFDTGETSTIGHSIYSTMLGGGSRLELSVAGYQGLFDTQVQLGALMDAGAGLLDGENILTSNVELPLGDFIVLLYESALGDLPPYVDETLRVLSVSLDPGLTIVPSEIFDIVGDPNLIDDQLFVNLGNLVETAGLVVNAVVPIDLAPILDLPGVATVIPTVTVIDPGSVAIGGEAFSEEGEPLTRAHTAQITVDARLSLLGATPATALLHVDVHAALAEASAAVTDIRCASTATPYHEIDVETVSSLAALEIRQLTLNLPPLLGGARNLGGGVVQVASQSRTPLTFGGAGVEFPQTLSAPAVSDDLAPALVDAVRGILLQADLPLVPAPLDSALDDFLATLLRDLSEPAVANALSDAFSGLGIKVAGADVTIESVSVKRPTLLTHQRGA